MDTKTDDLLAELVKGQREQTELFRRHLTRLKYSLRTLMLLMTFTCCLLGFWAWKSNTTPINTRPSVSSLPRTQSWEEMQLEKERAITEAAAAAQLERE